MKKIFKQDVNGVTYSMECVCPSCGEYSYNGNVCKKCLKEYSLLSEKEYHYEHECNDITYT